MSKRRVTLKILLFLVATDIFETLTQFFFKKSAMLQSSFTFKNLGDTIAFMKPLVFSPYLWLGFIFVFLTFVLWSTVLSKIDLSVAVPIASFSYILVPLVSIYFLHEVMTFLDWTGIFFILVGVVFVSMSSGKSKVSTQ
ncbi:MAG: EamA family transporter [Candidatus Omnitrophica bacterium]|nr:EamA family transporter [Candidatus Omnitrophota bacterium]